jgi:uncharacterized protein (DUF342 family)
MMSLEDCLQRIERARVRYGLNYAAVERSWNHCKTRNETIYGLLIAEATRPVRGEDGRVVYKAPLLDKRRVFDPGNISQRLLSTMVGSVDIGDVVVQIHPPRPGRPGRTVLGEELPAISGKAADFLLGDSLRLAPNKEDVIAVNPGTLVLEDGVLDIRPFLRVSERQTPDDGGDISFDGIVLLEKGADRIRVECEQLFSDAELSKVHLNVSGDARIRGPLESPQGETSFVGGRLFVESLSGGDIEALREVTVFGDILRAKVSSSDRIRTIQPQSRAVDVTLQALVGLMLQNVQGREDAPVHLRVGRDFIQGKARSRMESDLKAVETRLSHIQVLKDAVLKLGVSPMDLPEEQQDKLLELLGSEVSLKEQKESLEAEIAALDRKLLDFEKAMVKVSGTAEPPFVVEIGEHGFSATEAVSGGFFYYREGSGVEYRHQSE